MPQEEDMQSLQPPSLDSRDWKLGSFSTFSTFVMIRHVIHILWHFWGRQEQRSIGIILTPGLDQLQLKSYLGVFLVVGRLLCLWLCFYHHCHYCQHIALKVTFIFIINLGHVLSIASSFLQCLAIIKRWVTQDS